MKKIISLTLALIVVCIAVGCALLEEDIFITSNTSPDSSYTVILYQIGSPQWSFGAVKAKLVLTDKNGKEIEKQEFSFNNDGTGVTADNIIEVIWEIDRVEVKTREFDTANQYSYTLYFNNQVKNEANTNNPLGCYLRRFLSWACNVNKRLA